MDHDLLIGVLLTVVGAFIVAHYRVLVRKILTRGESEADRPAESVLIASALIVAVTLLLLFFFASGGQADLQSGFWQAVGISSVCNVFIGWCSYRALGDKDSPASLTIPILDTTPAFVIMTAWIVTGETPSAIGYVGILFLVAGTYTLNIHAAVEELKQGWSLRAVFAPFLALREKIGVRYAFAGALIGCISLPFDGVAARSGHPLLAVACIMSVPATVHTVRALVAGKGRQFFDRNRVMPAGALIGLLYAVAVGLYTISFRFMLVSYQATIKRIETVFVLMAAWYLLGERKHLKSRLAAVAFLVIGAILITASGR